jgi:hypothetical protein
METQETYEIPAFLRPSGRGRSIKATMHHDAGAYAQCSHCGRYSDNYKALAKDDWPCDCGRLHGWSGSFRTPTAEAKWSDATPNA